MQNQTWDAYWNTYPGPSRAERWLIRQRHDVLLHSLATYLPRRPLRILEIGCGYGSNSRLLGRLPQVSVTCLDSSRAAIAQVAPHVEAAVAGDVHALPWPQDQFDLVFSAGLLEHFADPQPIVNEANRTLRPGGLQVAFVPGKYSLWQLYRWLHGKHWQHGQESAYSARQLRDLFEACRLSICQTGGLDPFSINGVLMKLFGVRLPLRRGILSSAYTEIYAVGRKPDQDPTSQHVVQTNLPDFGRALRILVSRGNAGLRACGTLSSQPPARPQLVDHHAQQ